MTPEQSYRLDHLPPDSVVIAAEGECPVVRHASGRLQIIDEGGRCARPNVHVRRRTEQRVIDFFFPKVFGTIVQPYGPDGEPISTRVRS